MRRLLALLLPCACIDLELSADLEGPRVVGGSLAAPRTVEVPVRAALFVEFSEPIDPATVVVAVVPWTEVGACALTPNCGDPEATCERGRCQKDPIKPADLARMIDGEPPAGSPIGHVLEDTPATPSARLRITPTRALMAHARHSLLVFARDRSGAPLVDTDRVPAAWRRDLVTAGEGSSGPEARLVSPPDGADQVPPNLAHVDTAFARPVALDEAATLQLAGDAGDATLVDPSPCPGWVPGLCLRWRPDPPLRAGASYRAAGGSLRDLLGAPAVPAAAATGFTTAAAADERPPDLAPTFAVRGPCLYAALDADEPLALELSVGAATDLAVTGGGPVTLGLRLDRAVGDELAGRLVATDLAGNRRALDFEATIDASHPAGRPPLGLAEILTDPRGAEPRQEFVELADPRGDGEPAAWTDLRLADLAWPVVAAAVAAGEPPPGDPIPAFALRPGERALVVADGYDPNDGADPPPAPGTPLLRIGGSIGDGGLKNAGEPLTLYAWSGAGPPALIASYGLHVAADDHAGRSVVADPAACDLPRAWAAHPFGAASPGVAP